MSKDPFSSYRNAVATVFIVVLFVVLTLWLNHAAFDGKTPDRDIALKESSQSERPPIQFAPKEVGKGAPLTSPFADVAEKLKPAVVNISVVYKLLGSEHDNLKKNSPFWELFKEQFEQENRSKRAESSGTGVIISDDGYVITNNHVVENAEIIKVLLADGDERDAKLIGSDPDTDIALLKIGKVKDIQVATLGNSESIHIGDWAIAMGNALGLDWTLTVGVISATGRSGLSIFGGSPVYQDFIQTDASINHGNSGGPLANIYGEVIGINTAINESAQNIGFAIPVNMVKDVVADLVEYGEVVRGFLGMYPGELDNLKREALNIPEDMQGVFVEDVFADTPAEAGGLHPSDVVLEIDDEAVHTVTDFRYRVAQHKPGEKLNMTILRDGKKKTLDFTLSSRKDYFANLREERSQPRVNSDDSPWFGIEAEEINDQTIKEYKIKVDRGVVITHIIEGSAVEEVLERGDVLVSIGGEEVYSLADWKRLTAQLPQRDVAILIGYYPRGSEEIQMVLVRG
ncbi:trypsin-like peptidase domain-containing protein [bacterium]|nr:trypsin-like peptidase domain-containing protein [bacterium]